jgi:hypothetical protein
MKDHHLTVKHRKAENSRSMQRPPGRRGKLDRPVVDERLAAFLNRATIRLSPEGLTSSLSEQGLIEPLNPVSTRGLFSHLQQTVGNQYVNRMIQSKLKVGRPGDIYEQEADRVAEQVMSMPEPQSQRQPVEEEEQVQAKPIAEQITPLVQRQPEEEEEKKEEEQVQAKPIAEQITPLIQRQPEEEEKKEEELQAKATAGQTGEVSSGLESRINSMKGGGQPLPESTCAFFEPRFGYGFGQVRVHKDSQAAEAAHAVNARAFTVGRDIVFGAGRYAPETTEGRRLLAHELTHIVQQTGVKSNEQSVKNVAKKSSLYEQLMPSNIEIIQRASTTVGGITWYSTRAEAEAAVPTHVSPSSCFVWQGGGPTGYPWRVIPGTGCAHWVAHEMGISDTPGCYDGNAIRVSQVISGLTSQNLQNVNTGDIWTNSGRTHCGIVRGINRNSSGNVTSVSVEHCSSGQGGVVTNTFSSGLFWR